MTESRGDSARKPTALGGQRPFEGSAVHARARSALPQYGAAAIGPLLVSLRDLTALTKEQRDQLPPVLAMIGPCCTPVLVRHLADPHEHVRAVVAATLGHLRARDAVPRLAPLANDPSDHVRQAAADALGLIAAAGSPAPAPRWRVRRFRRRWPWKRADRRGGAARPDPADLAVATHGSQQPDVVPFGFPIGCPMRQRLLKTLAGRLAIAVPPVHVSLGFVINRLTGNLRRQRRA